MITIVYGLLLSIAQYFGIVLTERHVPWIPSFAAGVSITYIFLDLFPSFAQSASNISTYLFFSILAGFAVLHLSEKLLYFHARGKELRRELRIEHAIVSFIYHAIVGIVVVFIQQSFGTMPAVLFMIPSMFHTFVSESPLAIPSHKKYRLLVATAPLLGTLLATFAPITLIMYTALIGFVIGVVSYSVLRHGIPYGRKGNPLLFLAGIAVYSAILIWAGAL